MPHLHKKRIYVVWSKFDGSMLPLTFHFYHDLISLQLEVGTVIIWLVIGGVACLEDEWVDLVVLEKMCATFIGVAVVAVKEEVLGVELASSTGPTEDTHCLHPDIPVHISRWHVVG